MRRGSGAGTVEPARDSDIRLWEGPFEIFTGNWIINVAVPVFSYYGRLAEGSVEVSGISVSLEGWRVISVSRACGMEIFSREVVIF